MKKPRNVAHVTMIICLFLTMLTVSLCGIPFWNIPALFDADTLNLSREFQGGQSVTLSLSSESDAAALYPTFLKRSEALPYDDVSLENFGNGKITLTLPKKTGDSARELAELIAAPGVVSFTDSDGMEIIPREAVSHAKSGYGLMTADATSGAFFLEFFLKDEYRDAFRDATKNLAEKKEAGKNILHVKLDGTDILQATVSEAMTKESFLIGGRFEDATLPNLYEALFNSGEIQSDVSISAPLATEATLPVSYTAIWLLMFGVAVVISTIFLKFGIFAFSVFSHLCFYLFIGGFVYQTLNIRLSLASFCGLFTGMILLSLLNLFLALRLTKEIRFGRGTSMTLNSLSARVRTPFFISHIIFVVLSAVLLSIFSGIGSLAQDYIIPIFFTGLFSTLVSLLHTQFYFKLFAAIGFHESRHFGIRERSVEAL